MFSALKAVGHLLGLDPEEAKIRQAIRELRSLSDKELNDLGLSRGEITYVARNGRKGMDYAA